MFPVGEGTPVSIFANPRIQAFRNQMGLGGVSHCQQQLVKDNHLLFG